MRVLLVCMPFASVARPPLGISLLKTELVRDGLECDIAYFNLAFSTLIGRPVHERIAEGLPFSAMAGDWVFADCLYDRGGDGRGAYIVDILRARYRLGAEDVELVLGARAEAPRLLREQIAAIPWADYGIVGFTSFCSQNIAALALARQVKQKHPGLAIVFGGPNWRGVMGRELHRRFPFVDFVCSGEADRSFPALARHLASGDPDLTARVPGLVYRHAGRTRAVPESPPIADLDTLAEPDYSDFFRAWEELPAPRGPLPALQVEMSRGCSWAARGGCMFCGLNGPQKEYRTKTPGRVLREIRGLAWRWPCSAVELVDNLVPPSFYAEVLPSLAADPAPAPLFFEMRPDVTEDHVRLMADGRASVQPGIESLSDHVLRLMRKGTRALENVRFLKWCKTYGVTPYWNVIHGFPGETEADYEQMRAMLPAIGFLDAPRFCGPLALDRFSPYLTDPEKHGFVNVRPSAAYRHLYPFPDAALRRIAWTFDYDYREDVHPPCGVAQFEADVAAWRDGQTLGGLTVDSGESNERTIVDLRAGVPGHKYCLDEVDSLLWGACDAIATRHDLRTMVAERFPSEVASIDSRLAAFLRLGLMVTDGDRFLSLALSSPTAVDGADPVAHRGPQDALMAGYGEPAPAGRDAGPR